jgi:hypothetical protein
MSICALRCAKFLQAFVNLSLSARRHCSRRTLDGPDLLDSFIPATAPKQLA